LSLNKKNILYHFFYGTKCDFLILIGF
jgi:hypothetical protein